MKQSNNAKFVTEVTERSVVCVRKTFDIDNYPIYFIFFLSMISKYTINNVKY